MQEVVLLLLIIPIIHFIEAAIKLTKRPYLLKWRTTRNRVKPPETAKNQLQSSETTFFEKIWKLDVLSIFIRTLACNKYG